MNNSAQRRGVVYHCVFVLLIVFYSFFIFFYPTGFTATDYLCATYGTSINPSKTESDNADIAAATAIEKHNAARSTYEVDKSDSEKNVLKLTTETTENMAVALKAKNDAYEEARLSKIALIATITQNLEDTNAECLRIKTERDAHIAADQTVIEAMKPLLEQLKFCESSKDTIGIDTDAKKAEKAAAAAAAALAASEMTGRDCSEFDQQSGWKVVMGENVDYFKPKAGETLCSALKSTNKFLWQDGKMAHYIAPTPYSSHAGGSASGWPQQNVPGDHRTYLSFWSDSTSPNTQHISGENGCCHYTKNDPPNWGRSFKMYAIRTKCDPLEPTRCTPLDPELTSFLEVDANMEAKCAAATKQVSVLLELQGVSPFGQFKDFISRIDQETTLAMKSKVACDTQAKSVFDRDEKAAHDREQTTQDAEDEQYKTAIDILQTSLTNFKAAEQTRIDAQFVACCDATLATSKQSLRTKAVDLQTAKNAIFSTKKEQGRTEMTEAVSLKRVTIEQAGYHKTATVISRQSKLTIAKHAADATIDAASKNGEEYCTSAKNDLAAENQTLTQLKALFDTGLKTIGNSALGKQAEDQVEAERVEAERVEAERVEAERLAVEAATGRSVTCQMTIDNTMDSVEYNGKKLHINGATNDWGKTKTVTFATVYKGRLVVAGHDHESTNSGHCSSAGFVIKCSSPGPSGSSFWDGFNSGSKNILAQGSETSHGIDGHSTEFRWKKQKKPCTTTSGFHMNQIDSSLKKIWAPDGERGGKFTMGPEVGESCSKVTGYTLYEAHTENNHGDVCRVSSTNSNWNCPLGCTKTSPVRAPWCLKSGSTTEPCRSNR